MNTPFETPAPRPLKRHIWNSLGASKSFCIGLSIAILLLDFVTGPYIMFPIFFVIPVALAAWHHGLVFALVLSVILPVGRLFIALYVDHSMPLTYAITNAGIRVAVLAFIAALTSRTAHQTRELAREVKLLEGILPICMFCKRIRDNAQEWQQLEAYICEHSEADFSHGLCPECAQKHYGDILRMGRKS